MGKNDSVIERNLRTIIECQTYIKKNNDLNLSEITELDISQFVYSISTENTNTIFLFKI